MIKQRIGTELSLLGGRVRKGYLNRKDNIARAQSAMTSRTKMAARRTNYYVHDNAWSMIAIGAGLAFAAGFLLSRRNQEAITRDLAAEDPGVQEKVRKLNSWEFVHSALPLGLFLFKALQASRCARRP